MATIHHISPFIMAFWPMIGWNLLCTLFNVIGMSTGMSIPRWYGLRFFLLGACAVYLISLVLFWNVVL